MRLLNMVLKHVWVRDYTFTNICLVIISNPHQANTENGLHCKDPLLFTFLIKQLTKSVGGKSKEEGNQEKEWKDEEVLK